MQRHGSLDQSSDSSSSHRVTDVAFHAADSAILTFVSLSIEDSFKCRDFDRITNGRCCSMSLDQADLIGCDTRFGLSHRDRASLTGNARSRETCFLATVIINSAAFDDGVDSIAIGKCVGQPFDDDGTCTVGEHGSLSVSIERSTVTIGSSNTSFLVKVATVLWKLNTNRAGDRDITMPNR